MRSEQEMLDLILITAQEDGRIRAVIMNGSRASPSAPRDIFQDFDIVYVVTDVAPFKDDPDWIDRFGERMILQLPELMQDPPPSNDGGFTYLMQFMDGNRIDLGIYPLKMLPDLVKDSQSILLLDKDGLIGSFPPPSDRDHIPYPPTAKQFHDCCNEFWWVSPYVAKGLWREQITYAKSMFEFVRAELMKMLRWYVGIRTNFSKNPGKSGKYLQQYLEPELWELLLRTYADASYKHTWEELFATAELFRKVAIPVADQFGFDYPHDDDQRVSAHLLHVQFLPKDAKEMY
jgi:aminoglycoside 6-adenylyltransferase